MKKRNFYPKQVIKQLKGRNVNTLDAGERKALSFFFRKGRKYGMTVGIVGEAKAQDLLGANSCSGARLILANSTSRVLLKVK